MKIEILKGFLPLLLFAGMTCVNMICAEDRPNVIILITDDQGYGDISAHGNPYIRTPHLDAIHADSVRLMDFHVAPMCTPTRGQLLTGIDAARNRATNVSSGRTLLDPELPTLADVFAEAGYATGIFGKWHLGDNYPFRPQDRGFDETLWFPSSHINSVPDYWDNDYFEDTYWRNGERVAYEGYCTDVFFNEAMDWISKCEEEGKPFFLYLPTNAPHSPFWLPEENLKRVRQHLNDPATPKPSVGDAFPPNLAKFLGMIENIDDNIGRLDQFLERSDLFKETIFIFLTDNGSTFGERYFPAGMRGRKTQNWEGGHRVPCFWRWPEGGLSGGRELDGLTQVQDFAPTLYELCDIESSHRVDGESLAGPLSGEGAIDPERRLIINYSRMPHGQNYPIPGSPSLVTKEGGVVLWKKWRLFGDGQLYDLANDPLQQEEVSGRHPKVVATMQETLDGWWEGLGDKVNQAHRIVIGSEAKPETMLTACEWLDVFVDQQKQIRRGDWKNGYWLLDVAKEGRYRFELRRWPRELGLALSESAPEYETSFGDVLPAGRAIPISFSQFQIGPDPMFKAVPKGAESVVFEKDLDEGPIRLQTWLGEDRFHLPFGAYYVYVSRLEEASD
ncbi:MAG: arylsulfatase [Verrucomicrobiota bacterium]